MNAIQQPVSWFTHLRPAVATLALMTLITGAAYPLFVTVVAQSAFPEQANGSLLQDPSGAVRGSRLIAQKFEGDPWFHSRPSAGDFATVASAASNLSFSNPALAERVSKEAADLGANAQAPAPLALVTTSGSGLDPDLPVADVLYQLPRVAAARGIDPQVLRGQVQALAQRPAIGPAVVNILALNASLAELAGDRAR
ncbi:potassium-transporting ATPase subunit KdpC [Pseudomonas sp. D1-3]